MTAVVDDDLLAHLCVSHAVTPEHATKLVGDVLAYYDETVEDFVRRRHGELKSERQPNAAIFAQIRDELASRRVVPPG